MIGSLKQRMHGSPRLPVQTWVFTFHVCGKNYPIQLDLHKAVSQPKALMLAQEKMADLIKRNPEQTLFCPKYTHSGEPPLPPSTR